MSLGSRGALMRYPSAMHERPATRLYLTAGLAEGAEIPLDEAAAHRLRTVLRLAPGAAVAGFNPRDGEFLCRVSELRRGGGRLAVERRLRAPEPESDLWLVFAPIKRARLDWLVEKATELGASALVPVWTERTQPERLNLERLSAHAAAAAEQSERLSVPELRPGAARPDPRRLAGRSAAPRLRRDRRRHTDRDHWRDGGERRTGGAAGWPGRGVYRE